MPVPVISVSQMREWEEQTWAAGQTEAEVIARVGQQLAQIALRTTRPGDHIVLLAGKGHNGDDVRAMQPHLHNRRVEMIEVRDAVVASAAVSRALEASPALLVDGLFGIGLNRPLDHDWLHLIARINHAHARVLAVDVPSGLNADDGDVPTVAIRASETVTVGAPKAGLLTVDAAPYVGRLSVVNDVGLVPCPCTSERQWTLPGDFAGFPPARVVSSHKGTFGHLGILAGSGGYHGASVLAARGAQRARPGLITLLTQPSIYAAVAAQTQAVMVRVWDRDDLGAFTALLVGPGLASAELPPAVAATVREAWMSFEHPVLVDASALQWLPAGDFGNGLCRIITPHPGEAAKLLGVTAREVQADRPAAVRKLSGQFGNCYVVLKGNHTLIGRREGEMFVNSTGGPSLAQGGSGDLLAGYMAGALAQPQFHADPLMAIRHAVWEHGAAADRLDLRHKSWIVEELAEELGRATD